MYFRGCQRYNFELQSAINSLNVKWQLVEQGLKMVFWKLPCLIRKNDEALRKAGVLACRFDTPQLAYLIDLRERFALHRLERIFYLRSIKHLLRQALKNKEYSQKTFILDILFNSDSQFYYSAKECYSMSFKKLFVNTH